MEKTTQIERSIKMKSKNLKKLIAVLLAAALLPAVAVFNVSADSTEVLFTEDLFLVACREKQQPNGKQNNYRFEWFILFHAKLVFKVFASIILPIREGAGWS